MTAHPTSDFARGVGAAIKTIHHRIADLRVIEGNHILPSGRDRAAAEIAALEAVLPEILDLI